MQRVLEIIANAGDDLRTLGNTDQGRRYLERSRGLAESGNLDGWPIIAFGPPHANSRSKFQLEALTTSLAGRTTVVVDEDFWRPFV